MAEIRNYLVCRHLRGERSCYQLKYRGGKLRRSGRGLSFCFVPLSASIAEVPVDDRELTFLFHARSSDFQDVNAQGVINYRVVDPLTLSERIDFTIDLRTGLYLRHPLDQLSVMLTELAQQYVWAYVATTPVHAILGEGHEQIRERIAAGFEQDESLAAQGIEVVSVRVSAVKPDADLERALEMPVRESIQQQADEASFQRRAMAVEKERAIQENELQNQIELARREEQLIMQRGQNERQRATEQAQAEHIEVEARAERTRIDADARAGSIRVTEQAKVEAERERMHIYRDLPPNVMAGLAARELAGKLEKIEHLNVSPELLGPMLLNLVKAGTGRLAAGGDASS